MRIRKDQKLNFDGRCEGPQKRSRAFYSKRNSVDGKNFVDITALVRSIQRDEGHLACFRKGAFDCDETGCKWRSFCLEGNRSLGRNTI